VKIMLWQTKATLTEDLGIIINANSSW